MSTENSIKELQKRLDELFFQNALNEVYLKTLEKAIFELSSHLLTEDELSIFQKYYNHSLLSQSYQRINDLHSENTLFFPNRLAHELFDLHCRLKDFEKENNLCD